MNTFTRVRLLKEYGPHKKGALLDIDGDVEDLISGDDPTARVYDEEAERREKEAKEEEQKKEDERITRIVAKAVDELADNKGGDRPLIQVGKTGLERSHEKDGGFVNLAEHAMAVRKACHPHSPILDPRLKVAGNMEEGDDAQGGFLVPGQFIANLLEITPDEEQIIGRTTPIQMQTNRVNIPAINQTSRADGARYGGLTVYWTPEAGNKEISKPTFREVNLSLHKLTGMVHVSDELIEDSPITVGALIDRLFKTEMMFVLGQSFYRGTGVGQPLGILNAGCLITQAAEVPQAAATIVFMNIVNMWSRLWAPLRKNAIWLVNQDVEPELYNMGLAVGVGGGPAFMPAGGLSAVPYNTLMGRPVIASEYCSTLGTVGDIALCAWSEYLFARKSTAIQSAVSMHYRFNFDQQSFRFVLRADGQPWWASELTPKHGNNTMSPFVVLATRP